MYLKMFAGDNGNSQQPPASTSHRTNDDLNQRDDDLNYSVTFKSKKFPYEDEHTESNPYRSKVSTHTINSKNFRATNESLFDRDSQAPSKVFNELESRQDDSFKTSFKTRFGDNN